ncbi:MAG TPA: hypothetical protein VM142_08575 [Acidimicrobiales bacterium]|nr:hypothetical protein [Acidimicrobiales bacterium]
MSEPRSPVDQLLDLLVYAPVGIAMAVRDELPRLVEKGRSQADSQVALARMLGQMAAGKGQQEIARMLNEIWSRVSGGAGAPGESPPPTEPAVAPTRPGSRPSPRPSTTPSASDLAIPGYDALSAPQVVQRLSGLSPEELEAVGTYEAATRHRQTILGRIAQLQSGA